MKRHLFMLIVAGVLLMLAGVTAFAQSTAIGTVTTAHLNVRAAPFANAQIVAVVDRGYTAGIIGKNSDSSWYQIILEGTPGWVNGSYLTVTNAHTIPVTFTTTTTTQVTVTAIVTTGRLNTRAAPFANARLISTISQGDVVTVIGKNADSSWYQINLNGMTAWVNGSYLTISNGHLVPVTYGTPVPPVTITAIVATGRLNTRSAPSANATIVSTITQGDVVTVTGRNADSSWYQINLNGITAWVNGSYLTISNGHLVPITDTGITNPVAVTGYVNTGRLNIRSVPSPFFNQPITNVARNSSLTIIGRSANSNWLQVRTLSGIVGWVNGRYVTITGGNVATLPLTSG